MGGKRIANQVRRALIAAAKTGTVVIAIEASACGSHSVSCAGVCTKKICGPPTRATDASPHDAGNDRG